MLGFKAAFAAKWRSSLSTPKFMLLIIFYTREMSTRLLMYANCAFISIAVEILVTYAKNAAVRHLY